MQHGSPLIPVVISTGQTYNSGQGAAPVQQSSNLSTCSTVTADSFRNCVSPSGSTTSSSSTVSIRSHHHQFHTQAPSPMENFPSSPANSESSGRSCSSTTTKNKQEEQPTTSNELENESSFDQTNSSQSLDNSAGTGRVALSSNSSSNSSSRSGSSCGSEPSSPRPPGPTISSSFSKGGMLISSNQTVVDSPRSSSESVTNRNNNSVTFPSSSSSSSTAQQAQDFSQLQEHEIQKLAETAMHLVRSLPVHVKEPRLSRKIETSSYEFVLRLADDDPRKMEEIRRLSTIFGKASNGDTTSSKRSKGNGSKSVSVLELAMNEAAAQLCRLVPALLTKRDEMYSLARQVIRDSGLPYAVICANSNLPSSFYNNNNNNNIEVGERTKVKIDEIRNSPAHEERISNEFAAACKKIKLDIRGVGVQDTNGYHGPRKNSLSHTTENGMHITEIHNIPRRKSPSRESNHVTASALKKMALVASEFRNNSSKSSSLSIRT